MLLKMAADGETPSQAYDPDAGDETQPDVNLLQMARGLIPEASR
jgi:hypothetical protein